MRIRRHAKISQLVLDTAPSLKPGSALLRTYHCQLNQSPWDVATFSSPSSPSSPSTSPSFQVNRADASRGNSGSDRPISVGEREMQDNGNRDKMLVGDTLTTEKKKVKKEMAEVKKEQCCKTDGKSWRCQREAADGSSLCDHHLSLVKNYHNLAHNSTSKKPAAKSSPAVEPTRYSTRSSKKVSSPPHSREFYYYSGFRPGWSKKSSGQTSKSDDSGGPSKVDEKRDRVRSGACSQIGNEDQEIDSEEGEDEDDDYDEGEEDGGNGKKKTKRARKPIKARSLKSLMRE